MGEKSLQRLIRSMQPELLPGTFAFVTLREGRPMPAGLSPLMSYREPEGTTLILPELEAGRSGLPAAFFCRGISLSLHSSLYAVGFLAAVTERLAKAGMSVNIVSAYYRDYVFVPTDRAEEALRVLRQLASE